MANDTSTSNSDNFVPEPVPDAIADIELNGLEPADDSTDETVADEVQDETSEETTVDDTIIADDEAEAESTPTDEEETTEQPDEQPQQQTDNQKELARQQYEARQAQRQQRDYVSAQRAQIRDYEQQVPADDMAEQLNVLKAKQYVDTVERNRMGIQQDINRASSEIPFFKENTPQSQAAFQQAIENFATAYGVVDPDTNEWLGAQDREGNDVALLPYLQQQAAFYEQAITNATRSVQKTEAKMRAKAVNPSNPGKVTSSGNELDDLLERIGDTPLN